ncbi:MAG: alpha/beta hydrolase, partial [Bacteroidota bacterium]
MKQFNKLFLLLLVSAFALSANAQTRYLDDVFTGVNVTVDVPYASNISILTGAPDTIPLVMDIYTPDGDDATDRPVVVYFHTGSFLPQYFNGQITGNKQDSTCAEICRRLARKGYVAISATYRAGWVPTAVGAEGQNTRTGTLLNAAYRGIQDARSLIRFLRMTAAEMENPYGINTENITLWGQGTGGYL